jgi:putative phosphoribosyl transferase
VSPHLPLLERLEHPVSIPVDGVTLAGMLAVPDELGGVVLFAHGTGSGRHSPRNRFVAQALAEGRLSTLVIDLLTESEEPQDAETGELRFDIGLLSERLVAAIDWLGRDPRTQGRSVGLFGASTGAAAALEAATARPDRVRAVVSRGGRPDLAPRALPQVEAPTLLLVGGDDTPVIGMNKEALDLLRAEKRLEIIVGATHLFEEPGALERVAELACNWFLDHLPSHEAPDPGSAS